MTATYKVGDTYVRGAGVRKRTIMRAVYRAAALLIVVLALALAGDVLWKHSHISSHTQVSFDFGDEIPTDATILADSETSPGLVQTSTHAAKPAVDTFKPLLTKADEQAAKKKTR